MSKYWVKDRYEKKSTRIVYMFLRFLVILVLINHAYRRDFESVFLCALSLVLMIMPAIIEKEFWVRLPATLEIVILLFIFAAEILGEVNNFYVRMPQWDTVLHTINGFLCAAVGFALVDLLNRSRKFTFALSPVFLAVVAFCFSMTVGILWEFFECGCDRFLLQDMQKDTVVHQINSVAVSGDGTTRVTRIKDISGVIVVHSDGTMENLGVDGYLDIGLLDTMKDLWVNAIGAVIFSFIGYIYVKQRGKGRFAARFIPEIIRDGEQEET